MSGVMPPLPNTPSWRGAELKHRDKFTFHVFESGYVKGSKCGGRMILTWILGTQIFGSEVCETDSGCPEAVFLTQSQYVTHCNFIFEMYNYTICFALKNVQ